LLLFCLCTLAIKYFRIFWCVQSFAFQHVIFLILNKISLLCKLTMFLEIEKEVGVEGSPPPKGSFWRIFLLYKQNYISSVGQVFDMLNNLHVWVFVKWELKELKLKVKDHKFRVFEKKSESKNRCRFWLFQKNLTKLSGFTKTRKKGAR